MEDEKLIELLDERFAKVDERFTKIDERFTAVDEQFRQAAMKSERLEGDLRMLRLDLTLVKGKVEALTDEVKLPSGTIARRFAELREHVDTSDRQTRVLIEKVDGRFEGVNEHIDDPEAKLKR